MKKNKYIALCIFLMFMLSDSLFAQRRRIKLDKINYIRVAGMLYRDSTVQRGFTTRIDWISNIGLGTIYSGVIGDFQKFVGAVSGLNINSWYRTPLSAGSFLRMGLTLDLGGTRKIHDPTHNADFEFTHSLGVGLASAAGQQSC